MTLSRRDFLGAGVGLAAAGAAGVLSSCGSPATRVKPAGSDLGAVEHLVFVMQENRSFDHYFGTYPGVQGFDDRSDGAVSRFAQAWPTGPPGVTHLLPFPIASATAQICAGNASFPIHDWAPQHQSWDNGANDAFVSVHCLASNDWPEQGPLVMGYFTRQQLGYYYALADAFTLCDHYFSSVIGPTMPNRHYWMSAFLDPGGTHGGPVLETPGLSNSKEAVGSVSWETMPEALQDHGVSWKVYQPPGTSVGPLLDIALASGFNVLLYQRQFMANPNAALYQNAFLPSWPTDFAADVASGALPQVSWILPPLYASEHPNSSPAAGEWFVGQVLSTLMANAELWSKTVVVFTYDENGGYFDHLRPPTPPPGTAGEFVSAAGAQAEGSGVAGPIGLGFRVPCMIISPWSTGGYIDSTVYDHTSALRLIESRFGVAVPNLTPWRRAAVGDLTHALGFGSAPSRVAPTLPSTSLDLPAGCPTATDIAPFLSAPEPLNVPLPQTMPVQEPGAPRRR